MKGVYPLCLTCKHKCKQENIKSLICKMFEKETKEKRKTAQFEIFVN